MILRVYKRILPTKMDKLYYINFTILDERGKNNRLYLVKVFSKSINTITYKDSFLEEIKKLPYKDEITKIEFKTEEYKDLISSYYNV